ncbi:MULTISPECIES: carboxylesterase/lipase family protein [unclassified Crossiella]|uniref:carboxylesterase/lipase family protein n=1 Tax=unclassified Crossiella TaxID=2620835 RepID=UPI001FFE6D54|nr:MULTISPECIES: carboxylesterase family protein [unclassified Crossiella]MCK2239809.1 carboxylesterase family protein [Crossiella sp. S99.2]MCK2252504.1 carboxylesterase family protein [Crossiella sp. S99.1]
MRQATLLTTLVFSLLAAPAPGIANPSGPAAAANPAAAALSSPAVLLDPPAAAASNGPAAATDPAPATAAPGNLVLASAAPAGDLDRTTSGWVRGRSTPDLRVYQGIPYAQATRWSPPTPPTPWPGIREATQPGPVCAQPGPGGTVQGAEDCLSLDVHRPQGTDKLPVLVFVPGGGFTTGAGSQYNPARLATRGNLLVVTLNYRLGALGFLAHPGLGPDTGNLGLQDQQAALRWVRANIGAFGGDPARVTLWGQSAGGYSVCAHLSAPASQGLFHQAAIHSAPCANPMITRPEAQRRAQATATTLGCPDATCLRDLPLSALVGLHQDQLSLLRRDFNGRPWLPVTGTPTLPTPSHTARVPLLLGGTADEMAPFVAAQHRTLAAADYPTVVTGLFGEDAPAVLRRYPPQSQPTPALTLSRLLTDHGGVLGACTQLPVAEAARKPVYTFEFAEPTGHVVGDFPYGAAHGAELRYLLDLSWPQPPLTPAQQELANRMIDHWSAFVRTGDPGWPQHGPGRTMSFSAAHTGPIDLAARHDCGFWSWLG